MKTAILLTQSFLMLALIAVIPGRDSVQTITISQDEHFASLRNLEIAEQQLANVGFSFEGLEHWNTDQLRLALAAGTSRNDMLGGLEAYKREVDGYLTKHSGSFKVRAPDGSLVLMRVSAERRGELLAKTRMTLNTLTWLKQPEWLVLVASTKTEAPVPNGLRNLAAK